MNTIIAILRAAHCKSTHHFFAIDALDEVTTPRGKVLADLLLANYNDYLRGAKDPDNVFKDFENHVMHVRDGYWGGAAKTATKWLERCYKLLSANDWKEAAYAIGVLSHYFSDPFMPLHTAQSPRETIVHRPLEWSVCCAYQTIFKKACEDPQLESFSLATGHDWISDGILRGATMSNRFYEMLLDDYDMKESSRHPELALGVDSIQTLTQLFTWVLTGWGSALDRIANEVATGIPSVSLAIPTLLAGVQMPTKRIVAAIEAGDQRKEVEKILDEFQRTGNVVRNVAPEQRVVQKVRKERPELRPSPIEVQQVVNSDLLREALKPKPATEPPPRKAKPVAALPERNMQIRSEPTPQPAIQRVSPPRPKLSDLAPPIENPRSKQRETIGDTPKPVHKESEKPSRRPQLHGGSPIVDAPAIGPKTAARFHEIGLNTIDDLLTQDAEWIAQELNTNWITARLVAQWQDQARLACQIERISAAGTGLLVLAGIKTAKDLARHKVSDAMSKVHAAAQTAEGKRLLRDQEAPPLKTVQRWIDAASV